MAKFLTTRGTAYEVENIINNAKKSLVLVSPYLKISAPLFQTLQDADRRDVKIMLVYGKDELEPREGSKLAQLTNLSVHFLENVHAKCYFNEESMVITSMNLHEFSEQNNREMGVLITAKDDEDVFKEARKEAELIVRSSQKKGLKSTVERPSVVRTSTVRTDEAGYCIRCRKRLRFDLGKPLCSYCYAEWEIWEDPDYEENYCHTCGQRAETTIDKPQCYSCYARNR